MLEEHGAHHLVLAVGEPIGMKCNKRADHDDEQAEADPGADQQHQVRPGQLRDAPLRVREHVDDAPEQVRFHEHRQREREVGDGQRPAHAGFAPEQLEHAEIETKELHGAGTGNRWTYCSGRPSTNLSCRMNA